MVHLQNTPRTHGNLKREARKGFPSKITDMENNKPTTRELLKDIILDINIAKLSNKYFGKSSSWLYHKLDGTDGRIVSEFSEAERQQLKGALCDLADRIRKAADRL